MGARAAAILSLLWLVLAAPARRASAEELFTELGAMDVHPAAPAALPDLTGLAAGATPAVVGIITTESQTPRHGDDDAVQDLYGKARPGPRRGVGSGFVIHRDGWILTNAHVVEDSDKIEVELGKRNVRLPARLVGMDSESDLALLKIEAGRPLPFLRLGDSDQLRAAQWVLVIGSPFGLDHSVSLGIVSNTERDDISPVGRPGTYDFIQTDAPINPGNSGGPILDLQGAVIGIATAVNATGQGIGFAIPINMAKAVVGQLRSSGKVVRSWLGVSVKDLPPDLDDSAGVEVTEISRGGPAQKAGLRVGDVIVTVEGHAIRNPARLRWFVSTAGVGHEVALALQHRGEPDRTIKAVLAPAPAQEQARAELRPALGE
jgi:serine protease Do